MNRRNFLAAIPAAVSLPVMTSAAPIAPVLAGWVLVWRDCHGMEGFKDFLDGDRIFTPAKCFYGDYPEWKEKMTAGEMARMLLAKKPERYSVAYPVYL